MGSGVARSAAVRFVDGYGWRLTRLHYDERTRAYVARRTAEGLSKKDIIRCLKRFVAREIYRCLTATPPEPASTSPT